MNESYSTALEVVCKDRPNLLVDISTALSTTKVSITGMNVHATADGFAIFHVTISVTDAKQLDQVMRKLHGISSVMKVNRPAGCRARSAVLPDGQMRDWSAVIDQVYSPVTINRSEAQEKSFVHLFKGGGSRAKPWWVWAKPNIHS